MQRCKFSVLWSRHFFLFLKSSLGPLQPLPSHLATSLETDRIYLVWEWPGFKPRTPALYSSCATVVEPPPSTLEKYGSCQCFMETSRDSGGGTPFTIQHSPRCISVSNQYAELSIYMSLLRAVGLVQYLSFTVGLGISILRKEYELKKDMYVKTKRRDHLRMYSPKKTSQG